jgi:hypothetical protein
LEVNHILKCVHRSVCTKNNESDTDCKLIKAISSIRNEIMIKGLVLSNRFIDIVYDIIYAVVGGLNASFESGHWAAEKFNEWASKYRGKQ